MAGRRVRANDERSQAVLEALETLGQRLERVEALLQETQAERIARQAAQRQAEYARLLDQISALRWGGTDESPEAREARHTRLGELRARQAELLYDMGAVPGEQTGALLGLPRAG